MKIKKIQLNNFENHKETSLDLSKVNVIIGDNGEGKSGIVNGISLGVSGDLPTKPYNSYIKIGETSSSVKATIGIGESDREIGKSISEDGKIKTTLMKTDSLLQQIGTNKETMKTLINTWFFVKSADEKVRRNILSKVLIQTLSEENLIAILAEQSPKYIKQHTELIHNNYANLESNKKSQMEMLYKVAYDHRRDHKKQLESMNAAVAEIDTRLSMYKPEEPTIDKESIERTKRHAVLISNISQKEENLAQKEKLHNDKKGKVDELRASHSELQASITEKVEPEQVQEMRQKISIIESQIRGITSNIEKMNSDSDTYHCPYFESCKYEHIDKEVKEAVTNMTTAKEEKTGQIQELKTSLGAKEEQASISAKIKEIEGLISMAGKKIVSDEDNITAAKEEIATLKVQAKELEDAGIINTAGIEASKNQEQYVSLKERKKLLESDRTKINGIIEFLEDAVKIYGNKELWTKLLTSNKDTFIEKLKDIIKLLIPKYEPTIAEDLTISFDGISIDTLSESEKFRVGVAIQTALAISSKIGVVIIDGSDIVTDPTNIIHCINKLGQLPEIETLIATSSVNFVNPPEPLSGRPRQQANIEVTASHFTVSNGTVEKKEDIFGALSW